VERGVSRLVLHFLSLDHLDQLRAARVGLGVDDVDARRVGTGHHEVAALDVRVGRVGAKVRAAGVPAEVVQLVVAVRKIHLADEPAVAAGVGVDVHDAQRIGVPVGPGIEERHIGQRFGGGRRRHGGRGIE
jgi:hypothetical protein